MIIYKSLDNISLKVISETMNLAFSDYSIPIKFPVELLKNKFKAENILPELSVGAFNNDKLVGLILNGYKEINSRKIIYNGGTGVIPKFRGKRITLKMYEYLSPILKEKGIYNQQLEVIYDNVPAIKSYTKVGFQIKRKLNCYKGSINIYNSENKIAIKEIINYDWELLQSFWEINPSWQNDVNAIDNNKHNLHLLGAYMNNKFAGYLIFNPSNGRVHQFAVKKILEINILLLPYSYILKKITLKIFQLLMLMTPQ